MSKAMECDIAIIGGGSGGLSLAAGAAQLGAKVVLFEANKMGGDCLNTGCVPSKSLLAAAKMNYTPRIAKDFGVYMSQSDVHFPEVMAHVQSVIDGIAPHDSVERFTDLGVTVIEAPASFLDSNTLQGGGQQVKARKVVVATGSYPFVPPLTGLDNVSYYTNENIFQLTEQPVHLIVIGGGPIGCELAQAFAMLGSKVTILEMANILPKDEPDCVEIVKSALLDSGIDIHEGVQIENIESTANDSITVNVKTAQSSIACQGSHLLVATGRRANVKGLNLEKANVKYSDRGIEVDNRLRTSNKKIYAIGDVAGGFQFTHMANYHAGIVLQNILFKMPAKVSYHAVPWVTYTYPEMAHVGLLSSEMDPNKHQILELNFADNDRARADRHTKGKIKVIVNKKGQVMGATLVGAHAGELIFPWIMAVKEKKTLRAFTDCIVPYPTLNELSKRVAGQFYTPKLFNKKVKWLVNILKRLG